MRKLFLFILLLCSQPVVNCTGVDNSEQVLVYFPSHLEEATIIQDENRCFRLVHDDVDIEIQNCFVDTFIRNCTPNYLVRFFANGGYLVVKQFDDGELYVKAKMRLLGGGVIFCCIAAWAISCLMTEGAIAAGDAINGLVEKKHRNDQVFIKKLDVAVAKDNKIHHLANVPVLPKNLNDKEEIKGIKITESDVKAGPCFPDNKPIGIPNCIVGGSLPHVAHLPHIKLPPAKPAGPNGRPLIGQTTLV